MVQPGSATVRPASAWVRPADTVFHGRPVVRPGTGTAPAARPRQRLAAAGAAGDLTPRRDQGRQAPAGGAAALVPRVRARARGIPRPGAGVLRPAPVRG